MGIAPEYSPDRLLGGPVQIETVSRNEWEALLCARHEIPGNRLVCRGFLANSDVNCPYRANH